MNNGFLCYYNYIDQIDKIGNDAECWQMFKKVVEYSRGGEIPQFETDKFYQEIIFGLIKPSIDSAQNRYNDSIESGRKGGQYSKQYNNDEIMQMYNSGISKKEIAERLGCHINTVKNALKDNGTDNGQTTDRQRTILDKQRTDNDKHLKDKVNIKDKVNKKDNEKEKVLCTSMLDYTEEKKPEGGEDKNIIIYYADSYDELTEEQQSYLVRRIAIMKPKSEKPKDQE